VAGWENVKKNSRTRSNMILSPPYVSMIESLLQRDVVSSTLLRLFLQLALADDQDGYHLDRLFGCTCDCAVLRSAAPWAISLHGPAASAFFNCNGCRQQQSLASRDSHFRSPACCCCFIGYKSVRACFGTFEYCGGSTS